MSTDLIAIKMLFGTIMLEVGKDVQNLKKFPSGTINLTRYVHNPEYLAHYTIILVFGGLNFKQKHQCSSGCTPFKKYVYFTEGLAH